MGFCDNLSLGIVAERMPGLAGIPVERLATVAQQSCPGWALRIWH